MKNKLFVVNIILFIMAIIMTFVYHIYSGILLKSITASVFVVLCFINMMNIIKNVPDKKIFSIIMFIAQIICLVGDIVLWYEFMVGAIIFGVGHMFFILAYYYVEKFNKMDVMPCLILSLISVCIIIFVPSFNYGATIMEAVCAVYGCIISIMVGKAFSNFLQHKSLFCGLIFLGSILFFTSDLMLLLYVFAGASPITDVICLFTYFIGQCILAHSLYHVAYTKKIKMES